MKRFFLLIVLCVLIPLCNTSAEEAYRDVNLKASYILNIIPFVDFRKKEAPKTICVLGDDLLGVSLSYLQRKEKLSEEYKVHKISSLSKVSGCRILFVGRYNTLQRRAANLGKINKILTIGEIEEFTDLGGMIGLLEENQTIRLVINNTSIRESGMIIDPKLLKIAKWVK